jgi:hypothetical protein
MNRAPATEFTALPLTVAHCVDEICERFETDLQAGHRPSIEAYLADAPEPHRQSLFRALLELEIELLKSGGPKPEAREYTDRFPAYAAVVESVFAHGGAAPEAMGATTAGGYRFHILHRHARGTL